MKKNLIVPIVITLLLAGGIYWKVSHKDDPDVVNTEQATTTTTTDNTSSSSSRTSYASSGSTVTLNKPETPISGTLYGVIEVGASGFNAFAVNIDKEDNWEVAKKIFGKSLAKEGMASTDDIRNGLKEKAGELAETGVAGRNIHFVVSSGALKDAKVQSIMQELERSYVVQRVTADDESKYGVRAAIPKNYRDNSFMVDIGSGNTKISWFEDGRIRTTEELPGAKYYQDGQSDASVYDKIKTAAGKVPSSKRAYCFIIGGIPYELSKEGIPTSLSPRFTALKNPDEYSAGDNAKKRAGLNIYKAVSDGTGTSKFIFDADANFTIGYLLARN